MFMLMYIVLQSKTFNVSLTHLQLTSLHSVIVICLCYIEGKHISLSQAQFKTQEGTQENFSFV